MPRLTYIVLALLLPFLSASQTWKTFSDTSILFTAKYPANWVNKIKADKRVFFTSPSDGTNDQFLENVNISVTQNDTYGTDIKIKDVTPSIIANVKDAFSQFEKEGEKYFKWNTADACELTYTGYYKDNTEMKIRITQWFCFYKTRLYTLTFTGLANTDIHTATAHKIMNSIVFK